MAVALVADVVRYFQAVAYVISVSPARMAWGPIALLRLTRNQTSTITCILLYFNDPLTWCSMVLYLGGCGQAFYPHVVEGKT